MANMLIVWEGDPSERKCYIVDAGSAIADLARGSGNVYIGSNDNPDDAIHELNDELAGLTPVDEEGHLTGPFGEVVFCGYVM